MTTVKADAKGRLTGATPGEEYTKSITAEGAVVFTPKEPPIMPDLKSSKTIAAYIYPAAPGDRCNKILIDFPLGNTAILSGKIRTALRDLDVTEVHVKGKGIGGLWVDLLSQDEGLTVYEHTQK